MGSTLWPGLPFYNLVKEDKSVQTVVKKIRVYLKQNEIDINEKQLFGGYTILHHVCISRMKKLAKCLLNDFYGRIDVNALSFYNETALHFAIQGGNLEAVNALLRIGADPNIHRKDDGKTALHLSCHEGNVGILQSLIRRDAIKINAKDIYGWTALHYAVKQKNLPMVKMLLDHGADPNAVERKGRTPLHLATTGGCCYIIFALLEKGALVNVRSNLGCTPLHLAVKKSNEFAVRKFLEYSGDPNFSPTTRKNHIVHSALLQYNKMILYMILKTAEDVDVRDTKSLTPLQKAVQDGDAVGVKLLLQFKANTEVLWVNENKTLLLCSVETGDINITRMLLKTRALSHINVQSKMGFTPLMEAVELRRSDYVQLLLEHGADLKIKNKDGLTAIRIAADKGYGEILNILYSLDWK